MPTTTLRIFAVLFKQTWTTFAGRASDIKSFLRTLILHRQRKEYEAESDRRRLALMLMRPLIGILRYSKIIRSLFRKILETLFSPDLYSDLFEKYQPDLVISDTAGLEAGPIPAPPS